MKEIFVLAEHRQGQIRDITFEMLTKAREIAEKTNKESAVVLLGKDVKEHAKTLSEHAKNYAHCKGIRYISWNSPKKGNLREMIEEKKLHPVTCLKSLNRENTTRLAIEGIVFLKQFAREELETLKKITGIPFRKLKDIVKNAESLIEH